MIMQKVTYKLQIIKKSAEAEKKILNKNRASKRAATKDGGKTSKIREENGFCQR